MILIESTLLSAIGGAAGIGLGLLTLHSLQTVPLFRGKVETDAGMLLLVSALMASIVMGAICGVDPAWRGTRIPVIEGLRYE